MCNNRHQTSSNPLPAKRLISFGPGPVLALLLVNLMIPSGPVGTVAAAHPTPHYSVAPVYPAPRNQGLRPTRWRPWNRSTIYPVYPGMQPPPSSSMLRRRQQPGTLPPLPFEEEPWDEEWDEEEGQFSRDRPLGLDGDLAPKPPADLDPGLPLPDGRPRSDDLPPFLPDAEPETDLSEDLFPLPGEDQETIPKRDTEPGELDDDLFQTPAILPAPKEKPPVRKTGQKEGRWKSAGQVATHGPSERKDPEAGSTPKTWTRTKSSRLAEVRPPVESRTSPHPSQTAEPPNPLRHGSRLAQTHGDGSRVVPAAAWD